MDIGIHALVLTAIIPACCWLSFVYGRRPTSLPAGAARAALGVAAAAIIYSVPAALFTCLCGAGNNPLRQAAIPAVSAFICCCAMTTPRQRLQSAVGLLFIALTLSAHFDRLALPREPADRAHCRFTGDPEFAGNSCDNPGAASARWYTPITGLYALADRAR